MPVKCPNLGTRLETLRSHSDPFVPLVTVYSPIRQLMPDPDDCDSNAIPTEPRPRPSLQVYYTASLTTPYELETVALTLEKDVLKDRFQTSGADYERLDVYSLPPVTTTNSEEEAAKYGLFATPFLATTRRTKTVVATEAEEDAAVQRCVAHQRVATEAEEDAAVQRCVAHQRAEIAARENNGKDWYIQRYDVPRGEWRRAIIVVRTPVAEWEWGKRDKTGRGMVLSTVMFDHTEYGPNQVYVMSGSTEGEIRMLIHELRHELNWQHGFVQFLD